MKELQDRRVNYSNVILSGNIVLTKGVKENGNGEISEFEHVSLHFIPTVCGLVLPGTPAYHMSWFADSGDFVTSVLNKHLEMAEKTSDKKSGNDSYLFDTDVLTEIGDSVLNSLGTVMDPIGITVLVYELDGAHYLLNKAGEKMTYQTKDGMKHNKTVTEIAIPVFTVNGSIITNIQRVLEDRMNGLAPVVEEESTIGKIASMLAAARNETKE